MQLDLVEIWQHMGAPVRGVTVVLTLQAIAVATVTIDRLTMLALSRYRARSVAADSASFREGYADCHLSRFLASSLETYERLAQTGLGKSRAIELTRLNLERRSEGLHEELHRGMNVLASTGSTAPFVGLLGTVLGILHAFKVLASTQSAGVTAIGGAIGESLIVTGYGLVVAIPTVLVFNWLSQRLTHYEDEIVRTSGDLLERIEADPTFLALAPGTAA